LLGNVVRALDTLGVGNQVAERAIHIRRQRRPDYRGRALFEVDVDQLWDGIGPCLALPRTDLLAPPGRTCIECCSPASSSACTK
jgi:FAD-dependent urate hydroxylase